MYVLNPTKILNHTLRFFWLDFGTLSPAWQSLKTSPILGLGVLHWDGALGLNHQKSCFHGIWMEWANGILGGSECDRSWCFKPFFAGYTHSWASKQRFLRWAVIGSFRSHGGTPICHPVVMQDRSIEATVVTTGGFSMLGKPHGKGPMLHPGGSATSKVPARQRNARVPGTASNVHRTATCDSPWRRCWFNGWLEGKIWF